MKPSYFYLLFLVFTFFSPPVHAEGNLSRKKELSSVSVGQDTVEHPSGIIIDHAYLRRPVPKYDPGTVHIFLRNPTTRPIGITQVSINGMSLPRRYLQLEPSAWAGIPVNSIPAQSEEIQLPNDLFFCYQVLPNPVPPGKVGDVMVKLATPPGGVINAEILTSEGQKLNCSIRPSDNPFRITFMGFNKAYDTLYVYLENNSRQSLSIANVHLNTQNVTSLADMPWKVISPGEKQCIVVKLPEALKRGEYIAVKVQSAKPDLAASALVRVYSRFPISSWDGDTRTELFFDPISPFIEYHRRSLSQAEEDSRDDRKIYRVMCDPNSHDFRIRKLGATTLEVIKRAAECRADAARPTFININEPWRPRSYFIYGELTDIVAVNPYQMEIFCQPPESDGKFVALGKRACEPRLLYSIPEAFWFKDFVAGMPSPGEERLIVYTEIANGSKGILYYRRGGDNGYSTDQRLESEIGQINLELQVLKRFLVIGDPAPMATCAEEKVEVHTILCGHQRILLILLNKDYMRIRKDGMKKLIHKSKANFTVELKCPKWMDIKLAYEVGGDYKQVPFVRDSTNLLVRIEKLNVTKQIVLTTDPSDYDYDQDGDGISDVKEAAIFRTHPDLPAETPGHIRAPF